MASCSNIFRQLVLIKLLLTRQLYAFWMPFEINKITTKWNSIGKAMKKKMVSFQWYLSILGHMGLWKDMRSKPSSKSCPILLLFPLFLTLTIVPSPGHHRVSNGHCNDLFSDSFFQKILGGSSLTFCARILPIEGSTSHHILTVLVYFSKTTQ